ncbi:radical S-adenosyl methionine domain-containing protein 1, mitochondrial isoform X2 [Dermochelys coriacea]|uniref:radical S-adenosyl methionine domain-containing protein 1, mitochondrial isoform X2 n=1 Tax=Dermochelys coriacea TaxID=27794 RepID=UPI0018E87329|nr:radical S-adenosyl methionine domain-containing protein 1, mitochondrial isoform X2 [Dermochelys coriacea]
MRSCLTREAQTLIRLSQVQRISSVFFGGGTPSLASPLTIAAVLETVSRCAHLAADAEVTLEANPTSAGASQLAGFRASGVNRLSIGIQSLHDEELRLLGRNHTADEALGTLEEAKKLFPGRTSVDLIFGLPGQSVSSWARGLEELLQLCDDHVSLYQLTLERGTSLFKQVQRGSLPVPKQEVVAEMYESAREMLRDVGFRQYEVSNFARNGALSTHNLSYWQGSQYIGIGPGAHGRFVPRAHGESLREARIQTLEPDSWTKEVLACGHGTRKRTVLSQLEVLEEVLVLGLRTDIGITHQGAQVLLERFGSAGLSAADPPQPTPEVLGRQNSPSDLKLDSSQPESSSLSQRTPAVLDGQGTRRQIDLASNLESISAGEADPKEQLGSWLKSVWSP